MHYQRTIENLATSGVALHVLVITNRSNEAFRDEQARDRAYVFDQGTSQTGGRRQDLLSSMALAPGLDQVAEDLASQYKVGVRPPGRADSTESRARDRREASGHDGPRHAGASRDADRVETRGVDGCLAFPCPPRPAPRRGGAGRRLLPGSRPGAAGATAQLPLGDRRGLAQRHRDGSERAIRHGRAPGRLHRLRRRHAAGDQVLQSVEPAGGAVDPARHQREHGRQDRHRAGSRHRAS